MLKSEVVVHGTRSGGESIEMMNEHATFSTIYFLNPQTEVTVITPNMFRAHKCSSSGA